MYFEVLAKQGLASYAFEWITGHRNGIHCCAGDNRATDRRTPSGAGLLSSSARRWLAEADSSAAELLHVFSMTTLLHGRCPSKVASPETSTMAPAEEIGYVIPRNDECPKGSLKTEQASYLQALWCCFSARHGASLSSAKSPLCLKSNGKPSCWHLVVSSSVGRSCG